MKTGVLFLLAVIILSCHNKAIPEISRRTNFPPAPKPARQPIAENNPEAIAAGKIVFETRCNRCHGLKDIKGYTSQRWTTILQTMIPRARLNDAEAKQVRAYIMTNSSQ
ncbi:MAG: hypothetical protein Q8941_21005 [Bacteroidota bacterium]|nr:hypothetical protein [Bacteroidota bacterium]